jgi:hypothetical protein
MHGNVPAEKARAADVRELGEMGRMGRVPNQKSTTPAGIMRAKAGLMRRA